MTEYTSDPEAIAHYLAARNRTANWVDSITGKSLVAPSAPPSLVSDTDDGLSSQDSDAESSHSQPPRMVLRYPDGRPDVAVSAAWPPGSQKPLSTSPTYAHHYSSRPQPGSHGHHPSNPDMHSRVPSNAVPLYVTPPPPVIATHPETIHIRPSPTGPLSIQHNAYFPPDPHNDPSAAPRSRSRSIRSSNRPQVSLQMIYSPPPPVPLSSQSQSAPVSPTGEGFQPTQPPPPLPQPGLVIAPSPVYGFPPTSPPEPPQAAPPTGSSRTHSRTHSYSSNHSYPHPPAQPSSNPGPPPTLYHSGSTAQRPRRHSSRAGSTSHIDPHPHPHVDSQQSSSHTGSGISPSRRHGHNPPSIIYAPSANSSLYAYNPPVITTRPPPNMPIHSPTPHHAHAHRMAQSISDPTPIGGSLGRNGTSGRLFEDFSRTPSPNTARARAKESAKKDKSRKDKLRRRRRDSAGGVDNDDHDDGASFSSGSTYYVLPSPGQKIKVVVSVLLNCLALVMRRPDLSNCYFSFPTQPPPSMKGLYAEPTSASKSTPALRSHRSPNGPYPPPPPVPPQPSRPQKRPLLQRIFHPQFGFNSNANATYTSSSSRRTSRR
jgi:hypothetical protein